MGPANIGAVHRACVAPLEVDVDALDVDQQCDSMQQSVRSILSVWSLGGGP